MNTPNESDDIPVQGLGSVMRSLIWAIYIPSGIVGTCLNAITILLPLYVLELGGSPGFAAAVVGLRGIGSMVIGVPAGFAVARFGDKQVVMAGIVLVIATVVMIALCKTPGQVAPLALVFGASIGIWQLGRHAYVTEMTTTAQRGRIVSVMAGVQRVGWLIGPAAGGLVVEFAGFRTFFLCCAVLYLIALVIVMRSVRAGRGQRKTGSAGRRLFDLAMLTRGILLRIGPVMICLQVLRAARTLILPLWGAHIGLTPAEIGIAFSVASTIDMLMFYPAGLIIDHFGRRVVMIPAMLLMSASVMCLAWTDSFLAFVLLSAMGGLGNGFSSGIAMTLGGDLAPAAQRGEFLGLWRLIGDSGTAGGPLLIGLLTSSFALTGAGFAVGLIGLTGLVMVIFVMPETRSTGAK